MSTYGETLEMEHPNETRPSFRRPGEGLVARVNQTILRRLRHAAWGILDLQTEFEPLD